MLGTLKREQKREKGEEGIFNHCLRLEIPGEPKESSYERRVQERIGRGLRCRSPTEDTHCHKLKTRPRSALPAKQSQKQKPERREDTIRKKMKRRQMQSHWRAAAVWKGENAGDTAPS